MTIVTNDRRRQYLGNGTATTFTGPRAFRAQHIAVLLGEAGAYTLVPPDQYTVHRLGTANTIVEFDVAPAAGLDVLLLRTVPLDQPTDITNQGAFLPEIHEDTFDYLSMQIQQLSDAGLGEAIDPGTGEFVWDAKGMRIINVGDPKADQDAVNKRNGGGGGGGGGGDGTLRADLASVEPGKGAALVGYVQDVDGAVPRTVMDKLRETVTLADFDGAVPDGDSTAAIAAAEASAFPFIDLGGNTYYTTALHYNLSKGYYNGTLYARSYSGAYGRVKNLAPISDSELVADRTKSTVVDWAGRNILWLGTSIPHQGEGTVDSYPRLTAKALGAGVRNNAWAGSHVTYVESDPPNAITTIMALSMTNADRAAGLAKYGPSSAYSDDFDPITKASQQTSEARIWTPYASAYYDVVILDHAHNDAQRPEGLDGVEDIGIVSITPGSPTQITLTSIGSLVVGDSLYLRLDSSSGMQKMNWYAGRVQGISGNTVTMSINSSSVPAQAVSGYARKVDKTTVRGAWAFTIAFIYHSAYWFHGKYPTIMLAGAPSEFSGDFAKTDIYRVNSIVRGVSKTWGLAYYDVAGDMSVGLMEQKTYFPDKIHANTLETRQVIANHWVRWLAGGAVPVINADKLMTSADDVEWGDGDTVVFDEALGGFLPRTFSRTNPPAQIFSDNLQGAISGYTTIGTVVAGAANPWVSRNSMKVASAPGSPQNFIFRALSMFDVVDLSFRVYIPSGTLTTDVISTVNFLAIRNSAGQSLFSVGMSVNGGTNIKQLLATYTDDSAVFQAVPTSAELAPGEHLFRVYYRKGLSYSPGAFLIEVDGVIAGRGKLNNMAATDAAQVGLGLTFSNATESFDLYFNDLVVRTAETTPYSEAGGGGSGPVTSVGLSAPTGFSVSGSPVTGAGTLALAYAAGYKGYTTSESSKLSGIASGATVGADWSSTLSNIPANILSWASIAPSSKFNTPTGTTSQYVRGDGSLATMPAGGSGTVTSVGLSLPNIFSVGGSPVTSSGTLSATLSSQSAGYVLAAPAGSSGTPTFRALSATDIPILNQNTTGTAGTLATARAFTIGGSAKAFNGGSNVSWTLDEIGAVSMGTPVFNDAPRPSSDNLMTCGTSSRRWSSVYAASGTINTSDAREKTPVRSLDQAELAAAAELAGEIGAYKWLAAIEEKGDAARQHIGMTVQRAMEVMQSHGLDPLRYGFICHDEWSEQQGVIDRYSFRIDELLAFIARGFAYRLATIEQRLATLEG